MMTPRLFGENVDMSRSAAKTLRAPAALVAAGLVQPERLAELEQVTTRYALSLTPDVAALIDASDPHDPIARQFVPDKAELDTAVGEFADPIGDDAHSPVEGIVHRYPDRVLLKLVHVCPVYCRFCFRREMVGPGKRPGLSRAALERALDYIRAHPDIWEVILTGGDPLILSPRRLRAVTSSTGSRPSRTSSCCASTPVRPSPTRP
jgi:lysine 2,3-aminomutase